MAPTTQRTIRVPDDLWRKFRATADERGENPSEEIRKFIQRYVRRTK